MKGESNISGFLPFHRNGTVPCGLLQELQQTRLHQVTEQKEGLAGKISSLEFC